MRRKSLAPDLIGLYIVSVILFGDSGRLILIPNLLFGALLLVSLFCGWRFRLDRSPFVMCYALLFLEIILSLYWAADLGAVLSDIRKMALFALLMASIVRIIRRWGFPERIFRWIMSAGVFLLVYEVLLYGFGGLIRGIATGGRIGSEIAQLNNLGMYAATAAIVAFFYCCSRRRAVYLFPLLCSVLVMLSCGSRRAFLMFGACACMCLLLNARGSSRTVRRIRALSMIGIAACALLLISRTAMLSGVMERFGELAALLRGSSSDYSRKLLLVGGWESFLAHPILGLGSGNSHIVTMELFNNWKSYMHNNYLEMLVNLGVVGFLLYYSLYCQLIKRLMPLAKRGSFHAKLLLTLLVSQLVSDIAVTSYGSKFTYIIFALAYALIRSRPKRRREVRTYESPAGKAVL